MRAPVLRFAPGEPVRSCRFVLKWRASRIPWPHEGVEPMFAVGSNRLRIAALTASLLTIAAAVGASQSADASPEGRSAARVAAPGSIAPVTSCTTLQGLDLSRVDTSIASAGEVTRAGHQYCS